MAMTARRRHPNLLIILADQLRRQALGCYGDPDISTPNIDALAGSGVRFTSACSSYPVCVPFRFTLMTGQSAHSRMIPAINWRMAPAERTLADEFNAAGYETIYIGKWHLHGGHGPACLNMPIPRLHQGRWQQWLGFELRNNYFDTCYFANDDPTPHPLRGYQTDGLTDLAIETLCRRRAQRPFCCILSVEAPHPPFQAPPDDERRWRDREIHLPPNFMIPGEYDAATTTFPKQLTGADREQTIRDRRIYNAMVENLDTNIGRLLRGLEQAGRLDDTIVAVLSDHGELGGSHALAEKQYPYEESIGIPLIISGPGCGIPQDKRVECPAGTEDLFPTFLGLAGLRPTQPVDGEDLAPLVRGERADLERFGILLEFVQENRPGAGFHRATYRGVRSRRYKYTVFGGSEGLQPWQFFDLQDDPHELRNLVSEAQCAPLIREHHQWLRQRLAETLDSAWLAAAFGIDPLNPWRVTGK